MNEALQRTYAQMILKFGVNLQKGQGLFIWAPVESAAFVAILSEEAYYLGASAVVPAYFDPNVIRARIELGHPEYIGDYPVIEGWMQEQFAKQQFAFLKLNRFMSVGPSKTTKYKDQIVDSFHLSFKRLSTYTQKGLLQSCSSVVPTPSWAKLVFPGLEGDAGMNRLWQELGAMLQLEQEQCFELMRQRLEKKSKVRDELNQKQLKSLHFKSSSCDFWVDLIETHLWVGSMQYTKQTPSIGYLPNFPTEELFCGNKKYGIHGYFAITRPFLFQGNLIETLHLELMKGKIVSMQSAQDISQFQEYLMQREDRQFFGEIGLVSSRSPIAQRNLMFQSVLLDENAACHIAIGNGYECNIAEYTGNKKEYGLNESDIHIDLMFGSDDLVITAVHQDNKEEVLHI